MKKLTLLFILMLFACTLISQSHLPNRHSLDPSNPGYIQGEIIIKFIDDINLEPLLKGNSMNTGIPAIDGLFLEHKIVEMIKVFHMERKTEKRYINTYKGEKALVPQLFNIYRFKYNSVIDAKDLAAIVSQDPSVEYAEPNYLFYNMDTYPDDPFYQDGDQWYINAVNAPAAWDSVTGDTTQVIGIIDTGVDWDHPDLDDNIWTNWGEIPDNGIDDDGNGYIDDIRGWDFVNNDNNPNDDNSHGTHVAGIAAAETNNGSGMAGIAWNAVIMPLKTLQSSGTGTSSDLASAIEYAYENGATVINMSLGSYGESLTVKTALENAYSTAVLVAAAGNDGYKVDPPFPPCPRYQPFYPACYSFVIGVQATTPTGDLASFTNFDPSGPIIAANSYGHNYEISAPGDGILSCKPYGNYWLKSGTSMAAPIVAGAIALMKDNDPGQSTEEIFSRLIKGSNNGTLDIYGSLILELVPDLYYIDYTIVDTLPGCDSDGIADAGETIELHLAVKNAGGWADSVWAKMRFGQFEDTTTAVFHDSTSYIGDISTFATMTGEMDPFIIQIDSNVSNNRDIWFEYEIGANNHSSFTGELVINVQKGIEFFGFVNGLTHLTLDQYYIFSQNTVFDSLIIDPGVILRLCPEVSITIMEYFQAVGEPDSLITFTSAGSPYWGKIQYLGADPSTFKYCIFENGGPGYPNALINIDAENCIFRNNKLPFFLHWNTSVKYSNFVDNKDSYWPLSYNFLYGNIAYNNFSNNNKIHISASKDNFDNQIVYNTFITEDINFSFNTSYGNTFKTLSLPNNYWGTLDSTFIESSIIDYFENSDFPVLMGYDSILTRPSELNHGIVWKVEINDILVNRYDNPYNSPTGLGIIGSETLKFDVCFNRAMDTAYTPLLTFGVRPPYTQHVVFDSAFWSADSTVWTAYYTTGLETGDGIQRVRVAQATDDEHFDIPIENSRFEFIIQAASAQSINFQAIAGIGKVDLAWPPANTPDVQGYNLYRIHNLTDSTFSDTLRINSELVTDTVYSDFNVIPDTTYHYFYKILGTDMIESDFSKKATATPFNASNGDANGDMSVDVLDITIIVDFMLNQDPEPFLFDAADVNGDEEVNVLDIIGVIQLIMAKKSAPLGQIVTYSEIPAYYSIEDQQVILESEGHVRGLQFELKITEQENMEISSRLDGFEFSYAVVDDKMIGVLYSLSGKAIPAGTEEIFSFEPGNSQMYFSSIFGGDADGNYVSVLRREEAHPAYKEKTFHAYPNPFSNTTNLYFNLNQASWVTVEVFDLKGNRFATLFDGHKEAGLNLIRWDGIGKGKVRSSGVYLCKLTVEPMSREYLPYSEQIKIVLVK